MERIGAHAVGRVRRQASSTEYHDDRRRGARRDRARLRLLAIRIGEALAASGDPRRGARAATSARPARLGQADRRRAPRHGRVRPRAGAEIEGLGEHRGRDASCSRSRTRTWSRWRAAGCSRWCRTSSRCSTPRPRSAIHTERLRYGQRVTVVAFPCDPIWRGDARARAGRPARLRLRLRLRAGGGAGGVSSRPTCGSASTSAARTPTPSCSTATAGWSRKAKRPDDRGRHRRHHAPPLRRRAGGARGGAARSHRATSMLGTTHATNAVLERTRPRAGCASSGSARPDDVRSRPSSAGRPTCARRLGRRGDRRAAASSSTAARSSRSTPRRSRRFRERVAGRRRRPSRSTSVFASVSDRPRAGRGGHRARGARRRRRSRSATRSARIGLLERENATVLNAALLTGRLRGRRAPFGGGPRGARHRTR